MIPARFAPMLFGFILSGLMSLLISVIATFRAVGWSDNVFGVWMSGWLSSWPVAFPVVLIVAPFTRRVVAALVREPTD